MEAKLATLQGSDSDSDSDSDSESDDSDDDDDDEAGGSKKKVKKLRRKLAQLKMAQEYVHMAGIPSVSEGMDPTGVICCNRIIILLCV